MNYACMSLGVRNALANLAGRSEELGTITPERLLWELVNRGWVGGPLVKGLTELDEPGKLYAGEKWTRGTRDIIKRAGSEGEYISFQSLLKAIVTSGEVQVPSDVTLGWAQRQWAYWKMRDTDKLPYPELLRANLADLLADESSKTLAAAQILIRYYGLGGVPDQPVGEISRELDLSREAVIEAVKSPYSIKIGTLLAKPSGERELLTKNIIDRLSDKELRELALLVDKIGLGMSSIGMLRWGIISRGKLEVETYQAWHPADKGDLGRCTMAMENAPGWLREACVDLYNVFLDEIEGGK